MKIDIDMYLYGRCHIFALALSDVFGYDMEFFWDKEAWLDDKGERITTALVHAYCLLPNGDCMDARGARKKEEIVDEYEWNLPFYVKTTMEMLQEYIQKGILDKPEDGELETITAYIQKNISLYHFPSSEGMD